MIDLLVLVGSTCSSSVDGGVHRRVLPSVAWFCRVQSTTAWCPSAQARHVGLSLRPARWCRGLMQPDLGRCRKCFLTKPGETRKRTSISSRVPSPPSLRKSRDYLVATDLTLQGAVLDHQVILHSPSDIFGTAILVVLAHPKRMIEQTLARPEHCLSPHPRCRNILDEPESVRLGQLHHKLDLPTMQGV